MITRLAYMLIAASWLTAAAFGQELQRDQTVVVRMPPWVSFTHHDCTPIDPSAPGGTPEHPIDLQFFDEAWANSEYSDEPGVVAEPNKFECRWIRLDGFMTWLDHHYPGQFYEDALASYQRLNVNYFLEDFASGQPPRGDIAQRRLTIVGRFYDLCAAGEKAQREAGEEWRLSYPCHEVPAMMLADVRVEKIHDAAPQYILGEGNHAILNSLVTATPEQGKEIEPLVRAWAAALRKGLVFFTDAYLAQYPAMDAEDIREMRTEIKSPDSYPSHLLRQPRFMQLNLQKAPIQVFRSVDDDAFDTAIGCICLAASCADRWPLTEENAETFLGDAACVYLQRWNSPVWRW